MNTPFPLGDSSPCLRPSHSVLHSISMVLLGLQVSIEQVALGPISLTIWEGRERGATTEAGGLVDPPG